MSTPPFHTKGGHGCSSDEEILLQPFNSLLSSPNNNNLSINCTETTTIHHLSHIQRHHVSTLNADVIIRQVPSEGLSFQLWPAATSLFSLLNTHRLHRHLPLHPHRRIRILELGSGTGLVGITAAAILGADVTVTDLPHVIPNLEFNVAANGSIIAANSGTVVAAELTWGDVDQMETIGREYDVIVGSDVVYHDHLYEPLLNTLKFLLVKDEMVFLMAHLKRWKKETVFFRKAKKLFEVDVIHRDEPEDGKRVGVIVYRFVPRQKQLCKASKADF
ncbi:Protein-lysine methyltransferase METTL21C [Bienertia sinuspersici]